jgi:hypothetical protein
MSLPQNLPVGASRPSIIETSWNFPVSFVISLLLGVFILSAPFGLSGYSDFRQLYTAAWMVRAGHASELYDYATQWQFQKILTGHPVAPLPFNHLSYEALLLAPFSLLSYRAAYLAAAIFNLVLLTYTIHLLASRVVGISKGSGRIPLPVILGTVPIAICLVQGQDSILLLTLMAGAWFALDAGLEMKAGVLVALTLFKFQFSIPVALLFLAWRRWRFVAGFAITAFLIVIVSLWITGLNGFLTYAHMLTSMSIDLKTTADQTKYQISPWMMPNIRGLTYLLLPSRIEPIVTALGSMAVLLYAALKKPSFPLAVLVSMLISYHGLIHDASILQIPAVSLLALNRSPARMLVRNVMLVCPAALFPVGQLYCLMTVPLIWALPEVSRLPPDALAAPIAD